MWPFSWMGWQKTNSKKNACCHILNNGTKNKTVLQGLVDWQGSHSWYVFLCCRAVCLMLHTFSMYKILQPLEAAAMYFCSCVLHKLMLTVALLWDDSQSLWCHATGKAGQVSSAEWSGFFWANLYDKSVKAGGSMTSSCLQVCFRGDLCCLL